jgi:hypothetical protein
MTKDTRRNAPMRDGVVKRGTTWSYVIRVDGKPTWRGGFARRKDALDARHAQLAVLGKGGDPFPERIKLREFVHERLVPHWRTQGKPREATWQRYVALLDGWVLDTLGSVDLAKIGPLTFRRCSTR